MLRLLQVTYSKQVPSTPSAEGSEIKTGMGVVYDIATDTVSLPSAETNANIFFAEKERVATGIYASQANLSDYFEQFNTIAEGELCQRYKTYPGERVAVDQYAATVIANGAAVAAVGDPLAVGADGKWTVAAGTSRYQFGGLYDDAGTPLAIIETLDTNA